MEAASVDCTAPARAMAWKSPQRGILEIASVVTQRNSRTTPKEFLPQRKPRQFAREMVCKKTKARLPVPPPRERKVIIGDLRSAGMNRAAPSETVQ